MSISGIPDRLFVNCSDCKHRRKKKIMNRMGRGFKAKWFCNLTTPWRPLFGQKGCNKGKRRRNE